MAITTPGLMPFIPDASNYRYETVPQVGLNGRCGYQPRGRGLGGSSAINAMLYIRGAPWDYDHWAELGATGMKDMGRVMAELKARHGSELDMSKASAAVKAALG